MKKEKKTKVIPVRDFEYTLFFTSYFEVKI